MICDYVLIILIFLYLSFFFVYFYNHYNNFYKKEEEKRTYEEPKLTKLLFLVKFRDIEIEKFLLPEDFKQMDEYNKRKYALKHKKYYRIKASNKQISLISLINKFRKENNVGELIDDCGNEFEDLIIDNFSEPFFFENKNIFKLSNDNYLLKFPIQEFQKRFKDKAQNIVDILLNKRLNKICIIEKTLNIFIILFFSDEKNLSYSSNKIKDKIENKKINKVNDDNISSYEDML